MQHEAPWAYRSLEKTCRQLKLFVWTSKLLCDYSNMHQCENWIVQLNFTGAPENDQNSSRSFFFVLLSLLYVVGSFRAASVFRMQNIELILGD